MRWHWDEHQGTKRDSGIRECERGTVPSLDLPKYGEDDSSPSELTQDEDHPVFLLPTRTQGCTLVNTFYWVARTGQNLHSTPTSGCVTNSLLEASFCYKIERAEKQRFLPLPPLLLVHTETLIYPELVPKTVTKWEWFLFSAFHDITMAATVRWKIPVQPAWNFPLGQRLHPSSSVQTPLFM